MQWRMPGQPLASKVPRAPSYLLFALLLTVSSTAIGSTITIDFTGTVSILPTALRDGSTAVGSSVSGSISFATDPGSNTYPNPGVGRYEYVDDQIPISSFDITLGGNSYEMTIGAPPYPASHQIEVRDDYPFVLQDALFLTANVTGDSINGLMPQFAQFGLASTDLSRLSGIDVPSADEILSFLVSEGTQATNFLSFGGADTIRWSLSSFAVVVIPEPSTGLLIGFGLMASGLFMRQRSR